LQTTYENVLQSTLTFVKQVNTAEKNLLTEVKTRSPAIAEGPRDAGVPVEIW